GEDAPRAPVPVATGAGPRGPVAHAATSASTTTPPRRPPIPGRGLTRGWGTGNLDRRGTGHEHAAMLVLASASPRRRELLRWLVAEYDLDTAEIDESARAGEPAPAL